MVRQDLPVLMGEAGVHLSQLAHGQGGLVQWNNSTLPVARRHEDDAAEGQEVSIEATFASFTEKLLTGEETPAYVTDRWKECCIREANDIRYKAVGSQSSVNDGRELLKAADFLEKEAATWSLVQRAVCEEERLFLGKLAPDQRMNFSQRVANMINHDDDLLMCLQLVSWLEEIERRRSILESHGRKLDVPSRGVTWEDTKQQSNFLGINNDKLITEFDPDAPIRQGRGLTEDDRKDQQDLLKDVWELIRKGEFQDAIDLCCSRGQQWRAATLIGGGLTGPIPMYLDFESDDHLRQVLFSESSGDGGHLAWRQSCLNAARASKRAFQGPGLNYEAATYGLLCGDLPSVLPVCQTWEDFVWAYARCHLQLKAEKKVMTVDSNPFHEFQENSPWAELMEELGPIAEKRSLQSWPPDSMLSMLPSCCKEVFSLVESKAQPEIVKASKLPFSIIQQLIVKREYHSLFNKVLWPWVNDAHQALREPKSSEGHTENLLHCIPRFASHMSILLNVLKLDEGGTRSSDLIIQSHTLCLIDKGSFALVPQYISLLDGEHQQKFLDMTLHKMVDEPDDVKKEWALSAGRWLDQATSNEVLQQREPGQSDSQFVRTVVIHSMWCQKNPKFSPRQRVQAARWIFFYRLDSIHIQPSLGELQTLVNVFRDFAVSGPKCTEFAAELASYVPTSIYHARLRVVQDELKLFHHFFRVENDLQNWMDIIEDLCIEVSHGLVFIKGENWGKALARNTSPQSITSPMPILIERLKQLYRRGLELVDFDLRNLLADSWLRQSLKSAMGEQNEVNVEFRLCQAGDDETKYMLFANDSMEIAKQIINAWGSRLLRAHGIKVSHECRQGFIVTKATAPHQSVDALVSEVSLLAKKEVQKLEAVEVFHLTGSNPTVVKAICQQVCLGRLVIQFAKVQEVLWLLGRGLEGKSTVVEEVVRNKFLMDCLSPEECKTLFRREERTARNKHVTPALQM